MHEIRLLRPYYLAEIEAQESASPSSVVLLRTSNQTKWFEPNNHTTKGPKLLLLKSCTHSVRQGWKYIKSNFLLGNFALQDSEDCICSSEKVSHFTTSRQFLSGKKHTVWSALTAFIHFTVEIRFLGCSVTACHWCISVFLSKGWVLKDPLPRNLRSSCLYVWLLVAEKEGSGIKATQLSWSWLFIHLLEL